MKKIKNEVGSKFDPKTAVCGEFSIMEIFNFLKHHPMMVMSWGFCESTIIKKDKCMRFTVNGHHHKGYVYIVLGFLDLFDVYYTDKNDTIVKASNEVYIQDLIGTIDDDVERIPEYVR